jgi:hypothetical protein
MFSGATITNTSLSQLHCHLFQKQNVRMSNVQTSSLTGGRKGVPKQKLPYGKGLGQLVFRQTSSGQPLAKPQSHVPGFSNRKSDFF